MHVCSDWKRKGGMPTLLQEKCLRNLRWGADRGWQRTENCPGCGKATWDALVAAGYVEDKCKGPDRFVRITEKGARAVDEGLW